MKLNPKLLLDILYPIGSIYINTTGVNPGTFLGGTWSSFGTGRCLVGQDTSQTEFDTLGETGGSKTNKLTPENYAYKNYLTDSYNNPDLSTLFNPGDWYGIQAKNNTNNNVPVNNLQPYIVVSMWKRTA